MNIPGVLQSEMQVAHECFASPLNATLGDYNSLFMDVDKYYSSHGSFFDFCAIRPRVPQCPTSCLLCCGLLSAWAGSTGVRRL